jgi:hypothetical protein
MLETLLWALIVFLLGAVTVVVAAVAILMASEVD